MGLMTVRGLRAPSDSVAREIFNMGDDRLNCQTNDVGALVAEHVRGVQVNRVGDEAEQPDYRVSFEKIR